jgi:hypothetical protein
LGTWLLQAPETVWVLHYDALPMVRSQLALMYWIRDEVACKSKAENGGVPLLFTIFSFF